MTNRKHNFSAGPTVLPLPVLQTVQSELLDFKSSGMSLIEMSHRTPIFDDVIVRAKSSLAKLYNLPTLTRLCFYKVVQRYSSQ